MDNDDNDFQSKNRQLAGESSNKFPSVLQPYALPKFDFDDNLHGSLRFDSLVESEVFLGIENNEDSQWIEDFSRGSGGIQFTSNAAEPCSISLHNNVWSEATSSESVEMLLKSVGQEELIVAKTHTKSDACDELGCIVKQMEPNSKQNSNIASIAEDLTKPTVPPVQFLENSGLDDDGGRQLSQVEDISFSRGDASGHQGSRDLSAIGVEIKSPIAERSPPIDKCDGNSSNEIKADNAVKESSDDRIQEISPLETEVNNVVSTAPNIIEKDDGLDNKDASDNVIQTADTDLEILRTYQGEHHEKKYVTEVDEIHGQVSNAEVIESGVSGVDKARLSPMECVKGESAIQTNLCSVGEPSVISKEDSDMAIRHQSSIDTHGEPLVVIEDVSADHRCEVEVSNGSTLDKGIPVEAVSSPLPAEDNKGSEDKVDGKCSSYGAVNRSSSESHGETNVEDHVSSSMAAENVQMCENNVSGQHSVTDVDKYVPTEQQTDIVLSSVDIDVDGTHDQRASMSSFGETSVGEQTILKPEPDSTGGNESANAVSLPSGSDINKDADCVKVEASPLSTVPTCSDTAKETATRSSAKAGLYDLKAVPETTSGATSVSEPERGSPISAGQMLGKPVNQSIEASDSGNQIESHLLVIAEVTEECLKDKDVTLPVCDSTTDTRESVEDQMKGKGSNLNEHVNVKVSDQTMNAEMPGPKPSTTVEPLQDADHDFQKEVVMASKDIKVGQIPVPNDDVEREGIADLDKPASGSPTVIRSVQSSYDEKNKEGTKTILDQSVSVSEDKKQSASTYLNKTDASKGDGNFSFEVPPMTVTPQKSSRKKHASSAVEATKAMPTVDASTSGGLGRLDATIAPDISHQSPVVAYVPVKLSGSKGNTERKARRASGKAPAKERSNKRNPAKESASLKSDRGDKLTSVSLSPSFSQPVQSNEIQHIGNMDSSLLKPFMPVTSTAGLPDLNSSFSQAAAFRQPFTDLQQVQLRAQIFVYGALIQGTVPDEAYMISAFGGPDGGRSMWENPYRSFIERLHGHKSHLNTPEPRSGARPSEPSVKQSAVQSKVVSTPIGRGSSKSTPAIASPIVPFSSPLWTMPAPGGALQPSSMPRGPVVDLQRSLSPLHAHQSPGIRNFIGHSPSWLSQAPYGTPWVAPQNFTLDTSGRLSVQFPVAESVQPTPVKETSAHTSAMRPTGLPAQSVGSSSILAGSPVLSEKIISASGSQPPTDAKARKRKKNSTSVTTVQHAFPPQPLTESVLASVVASPLSTSVAFTTPVVFVSKGPTENAVTSMTPMLADFQKRDQTLEQKSILSEETLGKVKDAKVEAEDAAASAASAVSHSQQVWDQVEKQKNARLLPDVETKLASAAVAVAAAAAVAKAAAAAAKVASNAALQAKLIAEEAVASTKISQINVNLSKATPTSILKGDGTSSPASVLGVAKEAAKKKVEAASAAAIRAENMDAIVKAAELAAEAVSQAGKIVAMGDPMPLSELVAAGPEGYWKAASPELILRSNDTNVENRNISSGKEGPNSFTRHLNEVPSENKETYIVSQGKPPAPGDRFTGDQNRLIEGLPGSGEIMMKEPRVRKGRKASTLVKTFGVVPEPVNESKASIAQNEPEKEETPKENNIKEHSLVEVYKDGNGFKAAWFPAKVISIKDGKAHVEFTELALDEGSEKLKEWVPLESNGDEAPKIRTARPTDTVPSERTRKRRRAAMMDHVWSVGDRVDALIEDSWREGVVTEKNSQDESLLTVNFPARGEILVIPSALLHPSRVWKDGAWVEWSSSTASCLPSHGGDTPKEKRARVRSPVPEDKGKDKDKASGSEKAMESEKSDNPKLLSLSTDEKQFNIGKSSRTGTMRMPRSGLQKEGSRGVIFGVPKPGKKRKFMEVSKHYVRDQSSQPSEAKDSLKFTKYLMPHAPVSRGWRSSKSETNENQAGISRPKALRSGRSHNVSGRTVVEKDNSTDAENKAEGSSEEQNEMTFKPPYSSSSGAPERPVMSFSARAPATNAKPERASKGRLAPASARLQKPEEAKTLNSNSAGSASDSMEPRRSNRRIQPTSRLLEGLQTSSIMVSKIPSISHDRSNRSKNAFRGNNQG